MIKKSKQQFISIGILLAFLISMVPTGWITANVPDTKNLLVMFSDDFNGREESMTDNELKAAVKAKWGLTDETLILDNLPITYGVTNDTLPNIPGESETENKYFKPGTSDTGNSTSVLTKTFETAVNGLYEAYFYDTAGQSTNNRGGIWVTNAATNVTVYLGLVGSSGEYKTKYQVRVGSNYYYVAARTEGWHKFALDFTSGNGFQAFIDGSLVYPASGYDNSLKSFTAISIGANNWSCSATYFDNVRVMSDINLVSDKYSVDSENSLITNIPKDTDRTVAALKAHLSCENNQASIEVRGPGGNVLNDGDELTNDCTVALRLQNSEKVYAIRMGRTDTTLSAAGFVVDLQEKRIMNIPQADRVIGVFKSKLSQNAGGTFKVLRDGRELEDEDTLLLNDAVEVTAEDGVTKSLYIYVYKDLVASEKYVIDKLNSVITGVPYSDRAVDVFKQNFHSVAGIACSYDVYRSPDDTFGEEEKVTDFIVSGDKFVVSEQGSDSNEIQIYTISVAAVSTDTTLTSEKYTVDATLSVISGIPETDLMVNTFKAGLRVPVSAKLEVFQRDGLSMIEDWDIAQGDKVKITAEDGITYSIFTIGTIEGNSFLTSEKYIIYNIDGRIIDIPDSDKRVEVFLQNIEYPEGVAVSVIDSEGRPVTAGQMKEDYKIRLQPAETVGQTKDYTLEFGKNRPVVTGMKMSGTCLPGKQLSIEASCSDADGDAIEDVYYSWWKADTPDGEYSCIGGENNASYIVRPEDSGKYIKAGAMPVSSVSPKYGRGMLSSEATLCGDAAFKKTVTVSSQSGNAANVNDGNDKTYWCSEAGDKLPEIILDLGANMEFNRIVLKLYNAGWLYGYKVSCAPDSADLSLESSWRDIYTDAYATETEDNMFEKVTGRYIKLKVTDADQVVGLYDISVLNTQLTGEQKTAALNVTKDMLKALADKTQTYEADVVLPSMGWQGTKIVWTSSNSALLSVEEQTGRVTRPKDDTTIYLTATLSNGTANDEMRWEKRIAGTGGSTGTPSGSGGSKGSKAGSSFVVYTPAGLPSPTPAGINTEFSDIGESWAKTYIEGLAAEGIISGTADGRFEPQRLITREEFIKMLIEAFKLKDTSATTQFADVPSGSWFYPYVVSAQKLGIINGIGDGLFGVSSFITRQDMAVMTYRTLPVAGVEIERLDTAVAFEDDADIAAYAKSSIRAMAEAGIIEGMEGNIFMPDGNATREQAAKIIYLIYEQANAAKQQEAATGQQQPATEPQESAGGQQTEATVDNNDKLDLYLCIGQSNMASRAPIPENEGGIVERTFLLNGKDAWEPAKFDVLSASSNTSIQGYNRYSTVEALDKFNGFSSAYTFAQILSKDDPHRRIGLIVNAVGGTTLKQWQKGAGTRFFEEAVRRTKEAMKTGTLKGILWHQGEGDGGNTDYLPRLQNFVAELRAELGVDESVPFIASQLLPISKYSSFNGRIPDIAQYVPNSDYILSEGANDIGDSTHFDANGQKLLGERYAAKILSMVYGKNPDADNIQAEGNENENAEETE